MSLYNLLSYKHISVIIFTFFFILVGCSPGLYSGETVRATGFDANDIRNYGAVGDGVTDDTDAVRRAIKESDGSIRISGGIFRITETIEISMSSVNRISIQGDSGTGTIMMSGPGPAFRFTGTHLGTSNPASVTEEVWKRERMPVVENLEIKGDHPEADGLEFLNTLQPIVRGVLIQEVRHGIILRERSRNFILDSSHIYNCSGTGLFFDGVNLHQANVQGSHISFCKQGGIRSIGSEIRNLQITGNDIEYNYDPEAGQSADIWIDATVGSVREGTITGNTIQSVPSPGGANIRFTGAEDTYDKAGLWSITGNHISNANVNIHINSGRGFTITGNSFIRGIDRNIILNNSRNVIFSSNSIDNNPDYQEDAGNGITVRNSRGVLISDVQLEIAGSVENRKGAVEILKSREVTVTGCQLFNPFSTGIYIEDSRNVQVGQCLVNGNGGRENMGSSIEVKGRSKQVIILNNFTSGQIITEPGTSIVDGNHRLD